VADGTEATGIGELSTVLQQLPASNGKSASGSGSGKGGATATGKGGGQGKGGGPNLTGADLQQLARQIQLVTPPPSPPPTPPPAPTPTGPKVSPKVILGAAAGVAALIMAGVIVLGGGGNDEKTTATEASVAVTFPATVPATTAVAVTPTSAATTTTAASTTTTTIVAEPEIPAGTTMTLTMTSTAAHNGIAPVHNETNGQTVLGETRTATMVFADGCTPQHCAGQYSDQFPTGIYGVYGLSYTLFGNQPIPFTYADGTYSAAASAQVECGGVPRGDGLSLTTGTISWSFTILEPADDAAGSPLIQGVVSTTFSDDYTFLDSGPNLQDHTYCENTWGTLEFTGAPA
jgi:hypothetical protein